MKILDAGGYDMESVVRCYFGKSIKFLVNSSQTFVQLIMDRWKTVALSQYEPSVKLVEASYVLRIMSASLREIACCRCVVPKRCLYLPSSVAHGSSSSK